MQVNLVYKRTGELLIALADLLREIKVSGDYAHLLRGGFSADELDRQYKRTRQHLRVTAKDQLGLNCWHTTEGSQAQTLVITLTMANFMLHHLPAQVVWELQPPWAQHHLAILGWDTKFLNQAQAEETEAMSLLQPVNTNVDLQAEPIETRTYIYNREASTVSDDEIFAHIQNINDEVKKLEAFDTKPKKLEQRIEKLKANRDKLVKYVDSRA